MLATPVGFRQDFLAHIAMIAQAASSGFLAVLGDVGGSRRGFPSPQFGVNTW